MLQLICARLLFICPCFCLVFFLKQRFQILLAFLGCLHLCGGPLGLMQGIAWVGMSISYVSTDGVTEGLKKTFDGEHPCALCCAISEAKRDQQKQEPKNPAPNGKEQKFAKDWPILHEIVIYSFWGEDACFSLYPAQIDPVGIGAQTPPVPPPRLA